MESFSSFFDSQKRRSWSYDSLKNFRQISPAVENHLKRVYLTLCCALVASAIGAYLHMVWNIGGILTSLGCFGSMIWLIFSPPYQQTSKRISLLLISAVLEGASVGPLIKMAIDVNPSILITAFVGAELVFACFSAVPMLAKRREYLYLGGLLSTCLVNLMGLQFPCASFGSVSKFELYFGLLIFVGYMVVDTQRIIEKAHLGDMDYVKHSLTLFTDFVTVFLKLLIIMDTQKIIEKADLVGDMDSVKHSLILFADLVSVVLRILSMNSADKEEKKKKKKLKSSKNKRSSICQCHYYDD